MDETKELKNCNAIKTLLMCFVVLYHSMAIYAGGGLGDLILGQLMHQSLATWLIGLTHFTYMVLH